MSSAEYTANASGSTFANVKVTEPSTAVPPAAFPMMSLFLSASSLENDHSNRAVVASLAAAGSLGPATDTASPVPETSTDPARAAARSVVFADHSTLAGNPLADADAM